MRFTPPNTFSVFSTSESTSRNVLEGFVTSHLSGLEFRHSFFSQLDINGGIESALDVIAVAFDIVVFEENPVIFENLHGFLDGINCDAGNF